MFKKTFKDSVNVPGFYDSVDKKAQDGGSFIRVPYICKPFVKRAFGVDSYQIAISLSPTRPRKKGWKKVCFKRKEGAGCAYKDVFVSGRVCYDVDVNQQRMLRRLGMGSCFWMKVEATNE
jgi:hypothetical protein